MTLDVRRKMLADLSGGETVLLGRVLVPAVLVLGIGCKPRAHAAFNLRAECKIEVCVDPLHLVQGVALEGTEIDVDETTRMTAAQQFAALH